MTPVAACQWLCDPGGCPKTGLEILARLDVGVHPNGITVSDEELDSLNLKRAKFHGEWNYKLLPPPNK